MHTYECRYCEWSNSGWPAFYSVADLERHVERCHDTAERSAITAKVAAWRARKAPRRVVLCGSEAA